MMRQNWKRAVLLFLLSQTISLFGSSLVQHAMLFYVTLETQSGVMMAVGILCAFGPNLLVSPFGGVWADRYNRKLLIIGADGAIALVTLGLALAFGLGYRALWLMFLVAALRAVGSALQAPAVSAFLPQLVPKEHLARVNGINNTIQAAMILLSPIVGGALLTFASIEVAFYIDVITAAIGIGIFLLLKVPPHEKSQSARQAAYFADFFAGIRYIRKTPFFKSLFLFIGMFFFLAGPLAFLTALQITVAFGNDAWRLSAVEIALAIGMGVGGLLLSTWGGFKNKLTTIIVSAVAVGVCGVLLGCFVVFWVYILMAAVVGITIPLFSTPATVLLQQKADENYLGRLFGVFNTLASAILPIGMIPFGLLSEVVAIPILLAAIGVLFLGGAVLLYNSKALRAGACPTAEHDKIPAETPLSSGGDT